MAPLNLKMHHSNSSKTSKATSRLGKDTPIADALLPSLVSQPLQVKDNGEQALVKGEMEFKHFYEEHYLPYIQSVKRSWKIDVSLLKNHLLPRFQAFPMASIRPHMVQGLINGMRDQGLSPSSCNRALMLIRFMFNCAINWELLGSLQNPCRHVKEFRLNIQVENYLSVQDLKILQREVAKSKNTTLPYVVQLMILTGCRRGEVLGAKTVDFNLDRGDWVVPVSKSGQKRHIPLSPLAIETVVAALSFKSRQATLVKDSAYLFSNPQTGQAYVQIFFSWNKARKAAHLGHFRMHDLRHSFASAMVNSGMTLYDVKEILGHSNIKTTQRYAHLSNARLKAAAASVAEYFEEPSVLALEQVLVPRGRNARSSKGPGIDRSKETTKEENLKRRP
jgi:site-specific recombinase XerD